MTFNSSQIPGLESVRQQIAEAAARVGRSPDEVTLVAVSKTHPPEAVSAVLEAGHSIFGESRVQEARAKIPLVSSRARWHFVGHLQRNKIRHALPLFELFHSVDSLELAGDFDRIAAEAGSHPHVLLEVNVAAEASKFGFALEKLRAQMEDLLQLDRLNIDGLMCIPPPQPRAELARKFFVQLRELRDQLQSEFRVPLPQLSMGMSGDFPIAVEEGATFVRVGTAIFGERSGKTWKPSAENQSFDD
jgi:pyridoxal phosphate enzyme (YggS family)